MRSLEVKRHHGNGFTLLEIMLVVGIIAILVTVIVPTGFEMVAHARRTVTKESLRSLGLAMKRFHDETGAWPLVNTTWNPVLDSMVGPAAATADDTALFSRPAVLATLPACHTSTGPVATPCWGGPYLPKGESLGDPSVADAWGHPVRFAYFPKGHSAAPNGMIVVWSLGADGQDQSAGSLSDLARGKSAVEGADDIIQVVGSAF